MSEYIAHSSKTEPSPIDRGISADRSAGVSKNTSKKSESVPIDRAKPADRSAQLRESHRTSANRSWHQSRSIVSPTKPETASAPINRGLAADRSVKDLHAERCRFLSVLGSEFPPKLGQTLCSINRTQFWTKKGDLEHEKDCGHGENSREHRRRRLSIHRSRRIREDHRFSEFFLLFILYMFFPSNSMSIMNSRIYYSLYIIMRG